VAAQIKELGGHTYSMTRRKFLCKDREDISILRQGERSYLKTGDSSQFESDNTVPTSVDKFKLGQISYPATFHTTHIGESTSLVSL
jgi:hypothetical protein